jgi:hypothetical protein
MSIVIEYEVEDAVLVSPIKYTAKIASNEKFKNPKNLVKRKLSVVMTDARGRNAIGVEVFTFQVPLSTDALWLALDWIVENPWIGAFLGAVFLLTVGLMIYCCYRTCKDSKESEYSDDI